MAATEFKSSFWGIWVWKKKVKVIFWLCFKKACISALRKLFCPTYLIILTANDKNLMLLNLSDSWNQSTQECDLNRSCCMCDLGSFHSWLKFYVSWHVPNLDFRFVKLCCKAQRELWLPQNVWIFKQLRLIKRNIFHQWLIKH